MSTPRAELLNREFTIIRLLAAGEHTILEIIDHLAAHQHIHPTRAVQMTHHAMASIEGAGIPMRRRTVDNYELFSIDREAFFGPKVLTIFPDEASQQEMA